MQKFEHAFGKNDIRGIYGEDITEELYIHTGRGLVAYLKGIRQKSFRDVVYCLHGCTNPFAVAFKSTN